MDAYSGPSYVLGWYVNFVDSTPGGGGSTPAIDPTSAAQTGDIFAMFVALFLCIISMSLLICALFSKRFANAGGVVSAIAGKVNVVTKAIMIAISAALLCGSFLILTSHSHKALASDDVSSLNAAQTETVNIPYMTSDTVNAYVNTETGEITVDDYCLRAGDNMPYMYFNGLIISWMPEFGNLMCGNVEMKVNGNDYTSVSIPGTSSACQYFCDCKQDNNISLRITDVPTDVLKTLIGNTALSVNVMGKSTYKEPPTSKAMVAVSFSDSIFSEGVNPFIVDDDALNAYLEQTHAGWDKKEDHGALYYAKQVDLNTKTQDALQIWYDLMNTDIIKLKDGYQFYNFNIECTTESYLFDYTTDKDMIYFGLPINYKCLPYSIKDDHKINYKISLGGAELTEAGNEFLNQHSDTWIYNSYSKIISGDLPRTTEISDLKKLWLNPENPFVELKGAYCYGWKYNEGIICDHGDPEYFDIGAINNQMCWIYDRADITGKVIDSNGNPLNNCLVVYESENSENTIPVFTDVNGNYRLLVPLGDKGVINIYNNLAWWTEEAKFESIGRSFHIDNAQNQELPTTVLYYSYAFISIEVLSDTNAYYDGSTVKFVSDKDGLEFYSPLANSMKFCIPAGLTGTFYIDCPFDQYSPVTITEPLKDNEERKIAFTEKLTDHKPTNAKFSGTITYTDDGGQTYKPLSFGTILFDCSGVPQDLCKATTDENGYFELPFWAYINGQLMVYRDGDIEQQSPIYSSEFVYLAEGENYDFSVKITPYFATEE